MQNISNKESEQSSGQSTSPCAVNCPSWWISTGSQVPQSSLCMSLNLNMDSPTQCCHNAKQLGLQLHDQDSSSTQSTGQSHHEVPGMMGGNSQGQCISAQSGYYEAYGRLAEGHMKSILAFGTPEFTLPHSQIDYSHSLARIPYPCADPYFGSLVAAYGPQAIIHPHMLGMQPARLPLPLDLTEDEPVYVNAKQYHGILRRRKLRAKLEAENKLIKARKPYLHESRHRHAMKRVRGSGGRFLNTKKLQLSCEATTTADAQNVSDSAPLQLGSISESEVLQSDNANPNSGSASSVTSCSEVTSMSNHGTLFRQPELHYSGFQALHGGSVKAGGGIVFNGSHHRVSAIR